MKKYCKHIRFTILLVSIGFLISGGYMDAKATLSQVLIAHAWAHNVDRKQPSAKPWAWADTTAVAKLSVAELGITRYVMVDASGQSLAFGPGHMATSALPASAGHSMIAGHRDSHFAFLKDVRVGMQIEVENYLGQQTQYRVTQLDVIDTTTDALYASEDDMLTLVTCYPFEGMTSNTAQRYLVHAEML